MKNIVVLVPTEGEAAGFGEVFEHDFVEADKWYKARAGTIPVVVSGVGMAETAATAAAVAAARKPDAMVLAGIAGAYPWSGFVPGDCVSVMSERVADLGAIRDNGFVPLYGKKYACAMRLDALPAAEGYTVNCGGRPEDGCMGEGYFENVCQEYERTGNGSFESRREGERMEIGCSENISHEDELTESGLTNGRRTNGRWHGEHSDEHTGGRLAKGGRGQVESMEGAAFFAVCDALGIPFAEVRAVSNMTTDAAGEWQKEAAVRALAEGVKKITDEIKG